MRFFAAQSLLLGLFAITTPAKDLPAEPLTPLQERASFRLADDQLTIELVAAEPDVVSPVAIAWDADGRMFVAEMTDYPTGPTAGRIKLLEDRDGDGRHERVTVFAEKLDFPNGVLPWNDGVLVTAAPDIWFFKDTNGDGVADEKRVLFTGFGTGNQQLRVNGLMWGLDNWIYGANGRSDGDVRPPGAPPEKAVSIRRRDFRFEPRSGRFEAIAGQCQFGLARDDWGNRFLSWNTQAIRHEVLPERYLARNPYLAATESVLDILAPGDEGRVFPLTASPLVFNKESTSHFNALAGLTIYRGGALGPAYRGNAFVGESLRNLVHRRVLSADGVTFIARRGEEGREFLAGTDPWFHPVNYGTGPDGALYVVDFYRQFVEHPEWVPEQKRGSAAWRTGSEHGRIWRIRAKNSKLNSGNPRLSHASVAALVKQLGHENGWQRDTAQRLLVERQDHAAVPLLKSLVARRKTSPLARLHALHTLDGLAALTPEIILGALKSSDPAVREHAVQLSEPILSGKNGVTAKERNNLIAALFPLARDPEPRVRFQLALTAGEINGVLQLELLAHLARRDATNHWPALAILSGVGTEPLAFLKRLTQIEPDWVAAPMPKQARFLEETAALVGARQNDAELRECLAFIRQSAPGRGPLALLAGLAEGMKRANQSLRRWSQVAVASGETNHSLAKLFEQAGISAASEEEPLPYRLTAIRVLAQSDPAMAGKVLLDLLRSQAPPEVRSWAARTVVDFDDAGLARSLFANWSQYSIATKRQALTSALHASTTTAALVEALEKGQVSLVELDASTRQALQKKPDAALKPRIEKLLAAISSPDREQVISRFQPALKLTGDRRRGAEFFGKVCSVCHSIQGEGGNVGPDLSGIGSRPPEALLVDILDPSRAISPDFINYRLMTKAGQTFSGFIVAETAAGITIRRLGETDETVLRSQVAEMHAESNSLMPEGLDQGLDLQGMADLLNFLANPDKELLKESKPR